MRSASCFDYVAEFKLDLKRSQVTNIGKVRRLGLKQAINLDSTGLAPLSEVRLNKALHAPEH